MIGSIKATEVFEDTAFPISCRRHENHLSSALHRHDFHELVVILSGHGRHITDTENYPVQAGDVFLIRGDMAHGYAETDRMALANILFDPQRLKLPLGELRDVSGYHSLFRIEPGLRRVDRFRSRLRLSEEELSETARLILQLEEELEHKRPGYRFVACAHLMRLIAYLSRCYSREGKRSNQRLPRMGDVLSFIEQHYREPITIEQLCKQGHMSESTLMRCFRRVLSRSPIEHVIRVRIAHAEDTLRQQDDLRITDAAFECGFTDSNYFSRQFRRVTGLSPRAYRSRYGAIRDLTVRT
jgi:AraC family L-rhamnose operon transcriptional activator RhaR/AraC family L-rhamnose operon regulatory protein RhaS